MKYIFPIVMLFAAVSIDADASACPETLNFDMRPLNEKQSVNLCETYRGKVLLIVNTASRCAFTPQYEGLEAMHERYQTRGFAVLGFPSNDFGNQEPGTEKAVKDFCRLTYAVQFPMFQKTHAAKGRADPLYQKLGELAGEYPQWNFHKYLIDRDGRLVASFPSHVRPEHNSLVKAVEDLL